MLYSLIPKGSKVREKLQDWYFNLYVPKSLSKRFITLDEEKSTFLKKSLAKNIYGATTSVESPEVSRLTEELAVRISRHRSQIIPWLNSIKPLKNLRILEVGCGNGTSTVALAEQGAIVTAIDIDEGLLEDAQERCRIYGLEATFHLMNATDISTLLAGEQYDMILFYAVLEHMTYDERLVAIRQTYDLLSPGGLWCIVGTPNRIHFYDSHTSMLPFFYWLPDELAIKYASYSPRREFADSFNSNDEFQKDKQLEFARWGRGMSYHEFELALGPLERLNILSSLATFLKKRDIVYRVVQNTSSNGRYTSLFYKLYPQINRCFFDPFLDLIIQK